MFHDKLLEGPRYSVDYSDLDLEEIKELDFAEFLEKDLEFSLRTSILFGIFLFPTLLIVLLPLGYQTIILSLDVINTITRGSDFSLFYRFSLSRLSGTTIILYYLQPIFYLFITLYLLYSGVQLIKDLARKGWKLSSDESYLVNMIKSIRTENPIFLDRFIALDEEKKCYQMIGFPSALDPLSCYTAMSTGNLKTHVMGFVTGGWLFATGFMSFSIREEIVVSLTTDLAFNYLIGFLMLLTGLLFLIIFFFQFSYQFIRFLKFLDELIERQESYISSIIAKLLNYPKGFQELILEKQHAENQLKYFKSFKQMPIQILLRISTPLIPFALSIISLAL